MTKPSRAETFIGSLVVNKWAKHCWRGRGKQAGELDKGDKGYTNLLTQFASSFPNKAADHNMHFSFPSNLLQCSCAAGVYLQRAKQWLYSRSLPQIVLLVDLMGEYISLRIFFSNEDFMSTR